MEEFSFYLMVKYFSIIYNFSLSSNYELNFQNSPEHMASVTDIHDFTRAKFSLCELHENQVSKC